VGIIFDAIQFIETSLLSSALLFSIIMFVRTKDRLARRTLMVLLPVSTLLFISYMYSLNVKEAAKTVSWLTPLFALLVISLIMLSILAACFYVIQLFPITQHKKRRAMFSATGITAVLLITTAILVMYMSRTDLTQSVTTALWAFYPLCSIALFIEALAVAGMYRRITDAHNLRLAKYFLIAFLPQAAYSIIDFFLLRDISFQLTHISFAVFSVFVFVDLCSYFFRHYSHDLDISPKEEDLKEKYALSDREYEVIELLAKGMTNQTICETLHISVNTVKSHIKRIYKKMEISNRLQLVNLLGNGHTLNPEE
jgi:DNA-binding CsgD family transcriptional regulator